MGITGVCKPTSVFGPFGVSPTGRNPLQGNQQKGHVSSVQQRYVPATTEACQSATQGVAIDESE